MKKHIKQFLFSLLLSDYIRIIIGYIRWLYFFKLKRNFKLINNTPNSIENTVIYNSSVFNKFPLTDFIMKRMKWLLNAISSVEILNQSSSFLLIGSRTENEILFLKGKFNNPNINVIDLISYSPWIELQDMHDMKFKNNSFDCIICGWTINYSSNIQRAIDEIIRVSKKECIIAFGFEHTDSVTPKIDYKRINHISDLERIKINTTSELMSYFQARNNISAELIFNHNALMSEISIEEKVKKTGLASSQVMALILLKKS